MTLPGAYCECKLQRDNIGGHSTYLATLPEALSHAGIRLALRMRDGTWSDPWVVVAVFGEPIDGNTISHVRPSDILVCISKPER